MRPISSQIEAQPEEAPGSDVVDEDMDFVPTQIVDQSPMELEEVSSTTSVVVGESTDQETPEKKQKPRKLIKPTENKKKKKSKTLENTKENQENTDRRKLHTEPTTDSTPLGDQRAPLRVLPSRRAREQGVVNRRKHQQQMNKVYSEILDHIHQTCGISYETLASLLRQ